MINSFIHLLFRRRHFWRYASFDEVAELYASRTLRMLALNMIALFIAVYLYRDGYSLLFIAGFYVCYFLFKIPVTFVAAEIAAHLGPKHGILIANLLYIPALITFSFVSDYGIAALIVFGVFQAFAATIYDLCYLVDFSKVKHPLHAGKELGYMNILDKLATGLSPLIGGVVATFAGVETTMLIAAGLFAVAAIPLLRTAEPTATHQRVKYRGFPWRRNMRGFIAYGAIGYDTVIKGTMWILFITSTIFAAMQDELYATIGAISSVTLLAALAASYIYGKLIDGQRGRELLRFSVLLNAIVHLVRPFITSPVGVISNNIANETATTGYAMSFTRAMFDAADNSGNRISYMMGIELAFNIGATLAFGFLFGLLFMINDIDAMKLLFVVSAFVVLLIATPKFAMYRKK